MVSAKRMMSRISCRGRRLPAQRHLSNPTETMLAVSRRASDYLAEGPAPVVMDRPGGPFNGPSSIRDQTSRRCTLVRHLQIGPVCRQSLGVQAEAARMRVGDKDLTGLAPGSRRSGSEREQKLMRGEIVVGSAPVAQPLRLHVGIRLDAFCEPQHKTRHEFRVGRLTAWATEAHVRVFVNGLPGSSARCPLSLASRSYSNHEYDDSHFKHWALHGLEVRGLRVGGGGMIIGSWGLNV
jgi:hypothetical protein